jgi:predicted nucleotidyltransferase
MRFRDKDYIVSKQGVIFKIKSYVHPPGEALAFPRFIPFESISLTFWGQTWRIRGREYSRFDLRVVNKEEIQDTYSRFKRLYPEFIKNDPYLGEIIAVPAESIQEHITPQLALSRLREIGPKDELQRAALKFAKICSDLDIPSEDLGLTDSMMFDAHTVGFSDIDFVVYGGANYMKIYEYMKSQDCDPSIKFPTLGEWELAYEKTQVKDMPLSAAVYAKHKIRKYEQCTIDGQRLSIFAVRKFEEIEDEYGSSIETLGPLEIRGRIIRASEAMFRPSVYYVAVEEVLKGTHLLVSNILKIVNHRREYIFHVFEDEPVRALGLAQRIGKEIIMTLGSLELHGHDYLVAQELCD